MKATVKRQSDVADPLTGIRMSECERQAARAHLRQGGAYCRFLGRGDNGHAIHDALRRARVPGARANQARELAASSPHRARAQLCA